MKKQISLLSLLILGTLLFTLPTSLKAQDNNGLQSADESDQKWAIALHGGAGYVSPNMPEERKAAYMAALDSALAIGVEILEQGGSSLDAVEQTVRFLEDNPLFNAGRGAVFTSEGKNELDAAIMDGSQMNAGAATGLTTVKHPISLARIIMEESRHILFAGDGAEQYADQTEVERVDPDYFKVPARYEAWKRANESQGYLESQPNNAWKMGTVGCVAVDKTGRLVAGTSTGGMTNKRYGRVGDVPIIGSGTYADEQVAVSATGWGERIMLNVSAHRLASHIRYTGASLQESMNHLVYEILNEGEAGFIAVDRQGNISMETNTGSMFRASQSQRGEKTVAIWK
jgi:beta-aspartyl-peptidase (threonine type)